MTIGLVLTVKNEARILRQNLLYHKAIGVDKVFVYFDNSTDNGKALVRDLDFVEVSDSVSEDLYGEVECLQKFNSKAKIHHTARQCLNTYDAIEKCKLLNIDWLISLDADELVITHKSEASQLKTFFKTIESSIDVVNFKPYEILQTKHHYDNVFAEAILFKSTYMFTNKIDRVFKKFYNPFSRKTLSFSYWYGHHMGKSAIRINSTNKIIPQNVHRMVYVDNSNVRSIDKKGLLHYHIYDGEDFIKKFKNFKNHPNTFLSGNKVKGIKLLCRDIVNSDSYNYESLIKYFEKHIMFHPEEIRKLITNRNCFFIKRKQKTVVKITSVQSVFNNLNPNV